MKRLELSPLACADLDDIWLHIAEDNLSAADALVSTIYDAAHLLIEQPHMGPAREEFGAGRRSFSVEGYVIFYRPLADRIRIDRVLHGRRNITPGLL